MDLSENSVTKFKESIPLSFSSLPCAKTTKGNYLYFTPAQLYCLVDDTTISMCTTLDNVAPLKNKAISQKTLAPWYN